MRYWYVVMNCATVCTIQEMEVELLDAAYDGDIAKVKELLGQGLPVDVKAKVNCTCTHYSKSSLERCIHLGVVRALWYIGFGLQ